MAAGGPPAALLAAVRRGDERYVTWAAARPNWSDLVASTANEASYQTAIHVALQSEFSDLATNQHSDVKVLTKLLDRRHLILKALLQAKGAQAWSWCPIHGAVHYRLLAALKLFLEHSPQAELVRCLPERDIYGLHVLHVASSHKASGVAQRALLDGAPEILQITFDRIGVASYGGHGSHKASPSPADALAASPRARSRHSYNAAALNRAISVADLDALLSAGLALRSPPGSIADSMLHWLESTDHRGLTPLHHACRSGRAPAVRLLLRRGADALARVGEWGGTCGHLAASQGHMEALREYYVT